jgi:hypothetical protein
MLRIGAESTGSEAMSNFSRMPSAISAAMPCPFGGISCSVWPR